MLQQICQHVQAITYTGGAAGQIHDERPAAHTGHTAGKHGIRNPGIIREPNGVGNAGRFPGENRAGGLGSHIARREAGTTSGENHVRYIIIGPAGEPAGYLTRLIRHQFVCDDVILALVRPADDGGTVDVFVRLDPARNVLVVYIFFDQLG